MITKFDKTNMLSASRVANSLDISVKTLTNWYKWYLDDSIEKPDDFPKLPDYLQEHVGGPRFWTEADVEQLREFQAWIPRGRGGVMGRISSQYYPRTNTKSNGEKG